MEDLSAFKRLLSSPKHIVITMHAQPDADALGASLGLAAWLKKKHHHVSVISPTKHPDFLAWMPGIEEMLIFCEAKKEALELLQKATIIFCVDFSMLNRIDEMREVVQNTSATKIVVDHHLEPENFAALNFWNPKAAASAELIYELIEALGEKSWIDQDIANCLYAGIVTDTNSFKNANTTANVHLVAARLIDMGADVAKVNRLIYENNSLNRLKFISFALGQRLVVLQEYHTAYFVIKSMDSKTYNLQTGDTEGLVNYALSLKGILLAALIKEKKEAIFISLRSVGALAANTLAQKYFEGGGHKNAAGGKSYLSLQETIAKFERLVKENQSMYITNQ